MKTLSAMVLMAASLSAAAEVLFPDEDWYLAEIDQPAQCLTFCRYEDSSDQRICDVDADGDVDADDVKWILNRRGMASEYAFTPHSGDLNGDGVLSINDARGCLYQYGQY